LGYGTGWWDGYNGFEHPGSDSDPDVFWEKELERSKRSKSWYRIRNLLPILTKLHQQEIQRHQRLQLELRDLRNENQELLAQLRQCGYVDHKHQPGGGNTGPDITSS
jgi:hypothetical protein